MSRGFALLSLLLVLLPVSAVRALPRFAAQYGQSCHLCHVNPAGGGLRTSFGSQFFTGTERPPRGWPRNNWKNSARP